MVRLNIPTMPWADLLNRPAPTLLDLAGVNGDDHFFGESLFEATTAPRAFISNYQELGYYKNDKLIVLSPKKKAEAFSIDPMTYEAEKTALDPTLLAEVVAYYQTASHAFKYGAMKEYADGTANILVNNRVH